MPEAKRHDRSVIRIYSMQMSQWRKAAAKGIAVFDITVKSGLRAVAPDWDFLMEYKNSDKGPEAEAAYTVKYEAKMDKLEEKDPDFLINLLADQSAYTCYCPAGKFCHRHLLISRILRRAAERDMDVIYVGEIK